MKCSEIEQFIDPYLDGEFDSHEVREIEDHLAVCSECGDVVASRRVLNARLKSSSASVAPTHLKRAILSSLEHLESVEPSDHGALRQWSGWRALALAAAALLLVALATAGVAAQDEPNEAAATGDLASVIDEMNNLATTERVVQEALDWHRRRLPVEVTGPHAEEVRLWFDGKVDFPVTMPAFRDPGVALLGGRLAKVGDQNAALLTLVVRQRKLSMLVFPRQRVTMGPRLAARSTVEFRTASGYQVAIVHNGDLAYSLVSDLPAPELQRLVRTAQLPARY